eukprot:scaffold27451_cov81-Skeletonema_marinoi.AAC.2
MTEIGVDLTGVHIMCNNLARLELADLSGTKYLSGHGYVQTDVPLPFAWSANHRSQSTTSVRSSYSGISTKTSWNSFKVHLAKATLELIVLLPSLNVGCDRFLRNQLRQT